MENLEKMMNRIAALIAKAESTTHEAEAATYRAKAEELMRKYQLAEEDLIATDQFAILPIMRKIRLSEYASPYRHFHNWMFTPIAKHTGIRFVQRYEESGYTAYAVGYDSDLRYAEFLFNAARLMMISRLEPTVDLSLSDAENVYRLRTAGIERNRIAQMMWSADLGKAGHSAHAKVGKLYREACEARGEDATVSGRQISASTYREVYAREFVTQIYWRLQDARNAVDSLTGTLVPAGRAARVEEEFYRLFPEQRPAPAPEAPETNGKPQKSKALSKSAKAQVHRLYGSPTARRAAKAGREAADSVAIERVARAGRLPGESGEKGSCSGRPGELPA